MTNNTKPSYQGILTSLYPIASGQKQAKSEQNGGDNSHPKPYLLFDAGGTLVFPDQFFLIRQARARGIALTHAQLLEGYYELIYALDCQAAGQLDKVPAPSPRGYAHALFEILGIVDPAADAVARAFQDHHHHRKNLWAFTFARVRETLSCLARQGYRMSVISNSDGRTVNVFRNLGLAHYFERIFDSAILDIEKPDPAIFEVALRELKVASADALYIGDVFYVDVRGANLAGVGALHLDPLGLYAGWPGIHLADAGELPEWLASYSADSKILDALFPFKNPDNTIPACPSTAIPLPDPWSLWESFLPREGRAARVGA